MTEFDYARVQVVLLSLMSLSWLWYAHSLHTYNKAKAKYAKKQLEIMNSILLPGTKDHIEALKSASSELDASNDVIKEMLNR